MDDSMSHTCDLGGQMFDKNLKIALTDLCQSIARNIRSCLSV